MADTLTASSLIDIFDATATSAEYLLLLADRDGSVLTHPAFFHATGRPGSNVVRVPHLGHGYDLLTAATPGSDTANHAFSDGKTDVTIAIYDAVYDIDDMGRFAANGKVDPAMFAQWGAIQVAQTLISLVANITDGFTATAGSSGVNAAWSDVLVAKGLLGVAKAAGPICGLVHPVQWADLEADALSMGVLPAASNSGIINAGLSAYKGNYFGVDWFVSSAVPTSDAGANRAGGIFCNGGIAWADVEFPFGSDPNRISLGRGQIARERREVRHSDALVISHAMGAALAIDAAGVTLKTDA